MSWVDNLRSTIEAKFKAEWSATPAANIDFGDNSFSFETPISSSWVRLSINIIDNVNAEIGTKFQRASGIITVQCFTKIGIGEKDSNSLMDSAIAIFQNKSFNGINCYAMVPVKIGAQDNWFQQNAKFNFTYDIFS